MLPVAAILILGFTSQLVQGRTVPNEFQRLVAANNYFTTRLHSALSGNNRNYFYSSFGVLTVLDLLFEGASGKTQEELYRALGYEMHQIDPRDLRFLYKGYINNVTERTNDQQLKINQKVFLQYDLPLLARYYLKMVQYDASIEDVDFAEYEHIQKEINQWVSERTAGKIQNFLDFPPDPHSGFMHLNSFYAGGTFNRSACNLTRNMYPHTFYNNDQSKYDISVMDGDRCRVGFAESDELKSNLIELYLEHKNPLTLLIILPRDRYGLPDLEKRLNAENYRNAVASLNLTEVDVRLPIFTKESEPIDMEKTLQEIEIRSLFDHPDLGNMTHRKGLRLTDLPIQGGFRLNEKGLETAHAFGLRVTQGSRPQSGFRFQSARTKRQVDSSHVIPQVIVNHSFLWLVRDRNTGMILSSGRVAKLTTRDSPYDLPKSRPV